MRQPFSLPLRLRHCAAALVGLWLSTSAQAQVQELPLVAYRYTFATESKMDSSLSKSDIETLVAEVNRIWQPYDIRWKLETIIDQRIDATQFPALTGSEGRVDIRKRLQDIAPKGDDRKVWKMVLIKEFPVPAGGLYLPEVKTVYFADTARGGKTSPIILAHELGHSLGLSHQQAPTNLMNPAAGARNGATSDAQSLTADQSTTARRQAQEGPISNAYLAHDAGSDAPNSLVPSRPLAAAAPNRGGPDADQRRRMAERFRSFDRDGDGIVLIGDVPEAGHRAFQRLDRNGDGKLDADELSSLDR